MHRRQAEKMHPEPTHGEAGVAKHEHQDGETGRNRSNLTPDGSIADGARVASSLNIHIKYFYEKNTEKKDI
jgi:hypothetical protein